MKTKLTFAIAVALLLAAPAMADPMKCSGEQKACNASCVKAARVAVPDCMEACRASQMLCMRTGCWDTGVKRYCGLMKQ